MNCFDGSSTDNWLSCDFNVGPNTYLISQPRSTTWRELSERAQSNVTGRVDDILSRYRPAIREVQSFLDTCDEKCLFRYLEGYSRKKKSSVRLNYSFDNTIEEKIQREIERFFKTHPKANEILDWYEKYKGGNNGKRDIIQHVLVPILDGLESKTGIVVGFVPIRGGFITLVKDGERYHAARGDQVISWSSVKQVLSGFGSETTFFQMVDSKWRVIWTVETPASRALEAMIYIEEHQSIWQSITQWLKWWLTLESNYEGYKITLISPNNGIWVYGSHNEGEIQWIWRVTSNFSWLWLQYSAWSSHIRFGWGTWESRIWAEKIHSKQLFYSHSLWLGKYQIWGYNINPYWLWDTDICVQWKTKDVETAKWEASQSLLLWNDNLYLWVGNRWRWTPDLLGKKYYQTDSSKRILVGAKYQPYSIGLSHGKDGYSIEGWIQDKNTACTFSIEYRRKVHELLESVTEWKASCVKRF